ncbi:MAG: NAD+ synthase [Candidatus Theseobacter exili]|nr:NAD+ synthase [Candidatus Theseobacter exili]
MQIAIAQLNSKIGDITGNLQKAEKAICEACANNSELVVFPEMFITGYPPLDLLHRKSFLKSIEKAVIALKNITKKFPDTAVLTGTVTKTGKDSGKGLYNSAILVHNGEILFTQNKVLLPTYDVFDEMRYFDSGKEPDIFEYKGEKLGISICEDAWAGRLALDRKLYETDPVKQLANKGATLLINLSASPFYMNKEKLRYKIINGHAKEHNLPVIYVNSVGGNDELIFDGQSLCVDGNGNISSILPAFEECVKCINTNKKGEPGSFPFHDTVFSVYQALVLGLKDYTSKCGFFKVVLGLSGGIDSAVTACLAVKALGKENVLGLLMPSPYSSDSSVNDSKALANNLGIEYKLVEISNAMDAYDIILSSHFAGKEKDTTEENLQARIRGNLLMAFSNKFGYMLLSTGNKSEMAVGYCTLYGDMSGGLAVIADVPKLMVYELARFINSEKTIIPEAILTKPPSAELRPDQTDQDTLPPYEILDKIIHLAVDEDLSAEEIVKTGLPQKDVEWTVETLHRNEYKRRQAPPVLKVTARAFGMGRRIPITAASL